MRTPTEWKPAAIHELQHHLGSFTDWTLCGGYSLDMVVGRETRSHTDIDIGVFRSQLAACLQAIGKGQVFLCQPGGTRVAWDGEAVDPIVHDIWISDRERAHWLMQIMVFDDEGEKVFYRRDRRICWSKRRHAFQVDRLQVLNPLITFLYKANKPKIEEKEVQDIVALIEAAPNQPMQRTAGSHGK